MVSTTVAYLDNYFYPEALEKLSNALQAQGYHVLVFMASQTAGNIDTVLDEILDYQVDGIIMASASMSSDLASRCQNAGVPVVLFNRTQDMKGLTSVTSDNRQGGEVIGRFLVEGGHARLGFIAGWEGASTQRDREAGFLTALRESGMSLAAREVGDFRAEVASDAARRMFDRPADERPDAVFVANDHMAFAVMDVLRSELGLSVPDDVSVVGFDDVPPAAWAAYDLTTYRQPANTMVNETVSVLMDMIDGPYSDATSVTVDGKLVVRSSARKPEGWTL